MPNWKTHLEIGKKVNKYLNYQGSDYQIFLLANILPDINNSYLVKEVAVSIPHNVTHFVDDKNVTYDNFYHEYQKHIINKEPLFIGYLLHLFVDYNWNNDFYTKVLESKYANLTKNELKKLKQDDFALYNNKFINNCLDNLDIAKIVNECQKIKEIKINEQDIVFVQAFLRNQQLKIGNYCYYNEDYLDNILEKTINDFKKYLKK